VKAQKNEKESWREAKESGNTSNKVTQPPLTFATLSLSYDVFFIVAPAKSVNNRGKNLLLFYELSGRVIIIFIQHFCSHKTSEWVSWFGVKVLAVR
jgi:hypothetical protein